MILIYDGDCGFCTKTAEKIRRRLKEPVEITPWQKIDDLSKFGLSKTDVQTKVYFVDAAGKAFGGSAGFAHCSLHMKHGWPLLGRLLLLPGFAQLASWGYSIIAKNRYRFPGACVGCKTPQSDT